MKRQIINIAILIIALGFTSCENESIRVSGEVVRTEVSLTGYSGLKVANAFKAYVTFSESEEKIIIEANEDIQNKIEVKLVGDELIVQLEKGISIRGDATLNIYITTRNIDKYEISGASTVRLENVLIAEQVKLELSGASFFTAELSADFVEVTASGASNIDIFGTAIQLDAQLSGASSLTDYDLLIDELAINLSGASDAFLQVDKTIDVVASGASTLNYKGDAVIMEQELSGASKIIKSD